MAFNEEVVLRPGRSMIRLISAVGHETDVTLIDFAADRRARRRRRRRRSHPVRAELVAQILASTRQVAAWVRGQEARRIELRSQPRAAERGKSFGRAVAKARWAIRALPPRSGQTPRSIIRGSCGSPGG